MKPAAFTLPLQPLAPERAFAVRAQANNSPLPRWAGFEPVVLPVLRQVLRPIRIETWKSFDTAGFRVEVAETIGRRPSQEDAFLSPAPPGAVRMTRWPF